jgi:tryptophan-rich sensory protein
VYSLTFTWVGAVIFDSDGAAALVLVSGEKALQLGLQVIAKIKGFADAAQVPYRIWFIFGLVLDLKVKLC